MRRAVIASLIAASGCAYEASAIPSGPHAFALPSCIDVGVERRSDPAAVGPVVGFTVGNRCDHRVWIDFTRIAIEGRDASGAHIAMAAQDPRHEIGPDYLSARWFFNENIEFRAVTPADDALVSQLCIDPSGLEPGGATHWICLSGAP